MLSRRVELLLFARGLQCAARAFAELASGTKWIGGRRSFRFLFFLHIDLDYSFSEESLSPRRTLYTTMYPRRLCTFSMLLSACVKKV